MADGAEGVGFWLPSEFFDDFITEKENFCKNKKTESSSELCFPTEFPYELESLADSHFGKQWVMSTSPQSTLGGDGIWSARSRGGSSNGSPNGVYSPPTSPLGMEFDVVGDLIHRAAGQVAKLRLNGGGDGLMPAKHGNFMVESRNLNQFHPTPKSFNQNAFQLQQNFILKQQKQGFMQYGEKPQMHQMRSGGRATGGSIGYRPNGIAGAGAREVMLGGSGGSAAAKRGRAGTGVFLPRRYDNSGFSSDSRKKTGSSFVPERNSNANVHFLNKNFNNMNSFVQTQPEPHPKSFNRGFLSNYDLSVARVNALMLQHRRSLLLEQSSSPITHGKLLPQEWTY